MTPMMPDSVEANKDIEPPKQRYLTSGQKVQSLSKAKIITRKVREICVHS